MTHKYDELRAAITSMQKERGGLEGVYQDAYKYCLPLNANWQSRSQGYGANKLGHLFSTAGTQSVRRFGAFITGTTTPSSGNWYQFEDQNSELNKMEDVRMFYSRVTEMVGKAIRKTFYKAAVSAWTELALSYGCLYSYACRGKDGVMTGEVNFEHVPSVDVYYLNDGKGDLEMVARKLRYTAKEAERRIGKIPKQWREASDKDPSKTFVCWHIVRREKEEWEAGSFDDEFAFQGYYIADECKQGEEEILKQEGYRTMPYTVVGWNRVPSMSYSVGPVYEVLPEIMGANQSRRTLSLLHEMLARPPILAPEKSQIPRGFQLKPGTIIPGGITDGQERYRPMNIGGQLPPLFAQLSDEEQRIKAGFWENDMNTPISPNMTAFEVSQRVQQQAYSLAPFTILMIDSIQKMLIRTISVMDQAGVLPEVPEVLRQQNGDLQVNMIGPLAMAAKRGEIANLIEGVGMVQSLAAADPSGRASRVIKAEYAADYIFTTLGVDPGIINSPDELDKQDREAAQQQQAAMAQQQQGQLMEQMPKAAESAARARQLNAQAGILEGQRVDQ